MKTNSSKNNINNSYETIHKKLRGIELNKIAKESGFQQRKSQKITPKNFLLGFFLMAFSSGGNSFEQWAAKIGVLIKDTLSKQAVSKKITENQIGFLRKILEVIIRRSLFSRRKQTVKDFKNILLHDSTCINLNGALSKDYSGNENMYKKTKKSVLRIQTIYNLAKKSFTKFELTGYRENDLSKSYDILDFVQKGDLVIRDLGYFVSDILKEIGQMEAYYVSRLKMPINIYNVRTGEVINLYKLLKQKNTLDMKVIIGEDSRLKTRLIAARLDEKRANEKRRKCREKARQDKRKPRPSKELLEILGWAIFVTNVGKNKLSINQIKELYTIRWRIEIIFKCWKSYFKLSDVKQYDNKLRMESYIYCMLIFIVLFQTEFYRYIENISTEEISLMKFSKYISNNIVFLLLGEAFGRKHCQCFIKQILYYCKYESRTDRLNFNEKLSELG